MAIAAALYALARIAARLRSNCRASSASSEIAPGPRASRKPSSVIQTR